MRRLLHGTLALALFLWVGQVLGATLVKSNTIPGHFDDSFGTRPITFTAAELGGEPYVADVDVTIRFSKHPEDGEDPYFEEIEFSLSSPSGTSVTLIDNNPSSFNVGSGHDFEGSITFDQSAAVAVNVDRDVIPVGTFQPATNGGSLDSFLFENAAGTWSLFIQDNEEDDALIFFDYSIQLNTVVPEPSSLCLLSFGVGGLLVYALRKGE